MFLTKQFPFPSPKKRAHPSCFFPFKNTSLLCFSLLPNSSLSSQSPHFSFALLSISFSSFFLVFSPLFSSYLKPNHELTPFSFCPLEISTAKKKTNGNNFPLLSFFNFLIFLQSSKWPAFSLIVSLSSPKNGQPSSCLSKWLLYPQTKEASRGLYA